MNVINIINIFVTNVTEWQDVEPYHQGTAKLEL